MDIYHIWCNLKRDTSDMEFVACVKKYLDALKKTKSVETYRIMRKKLGFAPKEMYEFHIMIEFKNLHQFDQTFNKVAARKEPIEGFHYAVNSKVSEVKFALYRDFPDENRVVGEEKF